MAKVLGLRLLPLPAGRFAAAAMLSAAVLLPLSARAQAPEKPPDVTANSDGSCTFHQHLRGSGETTDINVANGATFHREEVKGGKTGIVYAPDRWFLCKDGHFSVTKSP